jgi:RimJ/RimL family protein N-acetyltransferase
VNPRRNEFGQPIGDPVEGWRPRPFPEPETLHGRFAVVEPLEPARHGRRLFAANSLDDGRMWTYLPYGPFPNLEDYEAWIEGAAAQRDPSFYAIVESRTGDPVGVASYLRIEPAMGVIEVGHLAYSPRLQRTPAATEAMFLMMRRIFDLGYRRYEWKCDSFNYPSRAAAQRLGFSYEGVFRQAVVVKDRNRDTAWFSIIDREWPALRAAFARWLAPENFDETGRQRESLSALTGPLLKAVDPGPGPNSV